MADPQPSNDALAFQTSISGFHREVFLIDAKRSRLYVGTGDNHSEPETKTSDAILAIDLDSGTIVWSKQLTEHNTFNIACVAVDQTNCPQPFQHLQSSELCQPEPEVHQQGRIRSAHGNLYAAWPYQLGALDRTGQSRINQTVKN
jgi:outer membrane protein assembly factor BamB